MISDKVFIEKKENIHLIIQQEIGLSKVIDKLKEDWDIVDVEKNGEILIFIREKKTKVGENNN